MALCFVGLRRCQSPGPDFRHGMQSIHLHFRDLAFKTEDFNGSEQLGIADKRDIGQAL